MSKYIFDIDVFHNRVIKTKEALNNVPLTFSVKANPFLLYDLPQELSHVEVCSPGELALCQEYDIPGSKIIYSGVNKETKDIEEAISYNTDIVTAESLLHVRYIDEVLSSSFTGKKQKVILRLTSGNQFGMSDKDILDVLSHRSSYENIDFIGIHYYSGTQKKIKAISKDIDTIKEFLNRAAEYAGWKPDIVEYGPGLSIDYFTEGFEEDEPIIPDETASLLNEFAKGYPLGIELGRFLSSTCGTYYTEVKDIKINDDTYYVICDGGIHQLKYHGQTLAMQIPPIEVIKKTNNNSDIKKNYCICGSLCTVSDVLVREVSLIELSVGDMLKFGRCGAYSVTEGSALFLSRDLPLIYVSSREHGQVLLRDEMLTYKINSKIQG